MTSCLMLDAFSEKLIYFYNKCMTQHVNVPFLYQNLNHVKGSIYSLRFANLKSKFLKFAS